MSDNWVPVTDGYEVSPMGRNHNASKTHCVRGHLLAEPNLRNRGKGRECLACHRGWEKIKKEKKS